MTPRTKTWFLNLGVAGKVAALMHAVVDDSTSVVQLESATAPTDVSNLADYWPSGHGAVGQYGASRFVGPTNLSTSLAWSWHHPDGRYHTILYGTAIDHEKNIFVTTDTSVWKLSPTGAVLWSFTPEPRATIFSAGSLLDGRMHFTSLDGRVWAIDMDTGKRLWERKVCEHINTDNGFVNAHEGVVVAATDRGNTTQMGRANLMVRAFRASDGEDLWAYTPQVPVWNFLASFPNDGTVVYQDWEGRAYRHNLQTGELLWKAGGWPHSWTDGSPLVNDGVIYTVGAYMSLPPGLGARAPGRFSAIRLSDGKVLYEKKLPMPPNNAPAIGRLAGSDQLSIVQPCGYQGRKGGVTSVFAFDAATGEDRWRFKGPSQANDRQAGEVEGYRERALAGATGGYVTNPWSAATIDAAGTAYVGHEDGLFFALRDVDGNKIVEGPEEVSSYDTGAAFVGSSGPAHAPGMVAVASCDSVFVFKSSAD